MSTGTGPDERREEFMDTAEKLFWENGIVHTTVAAIVKEMNVAKGLFYYYFDSKDDVIQAISEKYSRKVSQALQQAVDSAGDFNSRLHAFVVSTLTSFRKLWKKLDSVEQDIDISELSGRTIEEAKAAACQTLKSLLEEGNRSGFLHIDNPETFARALVGGMSDLARDTRSNLEEAARLIESMIRTIF